VGGLVQWAKNNLKKLNTNINYKQDNNLKKHPLTKVTKVKTPSNFNIKQTETKNR
jgi:hypothetical protein